MRPSRIAWSAIVGGGTALELWAVFTGRDDWTLSPHLRWALRCGTRAGNIVTPILVGAGSSWLAHHLQTVPPLKET